MNWFVKSLYAKSRKPRLIITALLIVVGLFYAAHVYGDVLPQRSLQLSDSQTSVTATYKLNFMIPASETLGSIKLQICANDPIFNDPCTAPTGFDISGAVLSAQSGATGFSVSPSGTNANTLVLTRTVGVAAA